LVASGRNDAAAGPVPLRRYRLARMRLSSPEATGAPRIARAKRS
jgi:hypothetical protein